MRRHSLAPSKRNARRSNAWLVVHGGAGISLIAPGRRTRAPKGPTPVIRTPFNAKRMPMAVVLAFAPDGSEAKVMLSTRPGTHNETSLTAFVSHLRRQFHRDKVTLIWEGSPSQRSRRMHAFLATQLSWRVVERLPADAPDLNPVEGLWGNLKGTELANLCVDTIAETEYRARRSIRLIKKEKNLTVAFLRHTGLSL